MAKLTGAACRAGRALLKWSMRDLAAASGVSLPTLLKLENDGQVSAETAEKVTAAFESKGVEITNGDGTGARLLFVEAYPHKRDNGEWAVATRWREGDPLALVAPDVARSAAQEARARGDGRTADALERAASDADRQARGARA